MMSNVSVYLFVVNKIIRTMSARINYHANIQISSFSIEIEIAVPLTNNPSKATYIPERRRS